MAEATDMLVGAAEIAAMLDVDPETVEELPGSEALLRAGTPFPRPLGLDDHEPVWDLADIAEWRAARREAWREAPAGRPV